MAIYGPTNSGFSRSEDLHCVWAFDVEHTTCTSVINEHNITNVPAQTEDVSVPVVTVAVLQQH